MAPVTTTYASTQEAVPVRIVPKVEALRARLVAPLPDDGIWGWLGPLIVTAIAGFTRFWHLGRPHNFVFDETYYAKDGWALLHYGAEQDYVKGADAKILAGNTGTDIFTGKPAYVVHPPFGKWMIGVGEKLFGFTPFGWRFAAALTGTLAVLLIARIGRRLFRSTLLGCVAGLLMTVDGMAYVHARIALLDPLLMFWVLAAFGALVVDRDKARLAFAERVANQPARLFGPGMGLRPWRLLAGVCLGLACGTKWNGLFFVMAFGLMTVFWDAGARKAVGVRMPRIGAVLRDAGPAFVSLVLVGFVTYLLCWTGWFLGDDRAYLRNYAATHPGPALVPDALYSLWHYHVEVYKFNTNLHSFHPYKSNPWSWLVMGRPTSYFYEGKTEGVEGCQVAECSKAIVALGNPTVWWAALLSLPVLGWLWAARRDWRAGAILSGIAGGYLPWFYYSDRTIYTFYAIAFLPYLVLAVTMVLGLVLGPPGATGARRQYGASAVGAYLLLAVANFFWLLPVLSAEVIPRTDWLRRMWLRSWI
jgi:dolichyl-phosphate-mannose-protein mannosyltransferase